MLILNLPLDIVAKIRQMQARTLNSSTTTHRISWQITLKGNGDGYSLAIWSDDTYSYALSFTPQVEEETVTAIIQAMSAK